MNPLDHLFDDGGQPIRRNAKFLYWRDENGNLCFEDVNADGVSLPPSGSIDHDLVDKILHCGHPASDGIGGKCTELGCSNISCKACFTGTACHVCFKNLCLEHKNEIECDGVIRVVCGRCKDEIQHQRRKRAVIHFLLSPFVEFKDRKK